MVNGAMPWMQLRRGPKHEPRPHQFLVLMDNNMSPRQDGHLGPGAWMCKPSLIPGPDLYSRTFLAPLLNGHWLPFLFFSPRPVSTQQESWLRLWGYLCSLHTLLSTMHLFFFLPSRDWLPWTPYLSFHISKSSLNKPPNTLFRGLKPGMGTQGEWHRPCPLGT